MKLGTLITVKQLIEAITKFPKSIRVLDSSWHSVATGRDPFAEYIAGHIPGAQFFDLEECRDKESKYDHMLPSPSDFEYYISHLGIRNDMHVILYENNTSGFYSAPRAWYNFRAFGHQSISLLNGGLPRWIAEGQPITKETYIVPKEKYKANFNSDIVISLGQILENLRNEKFQVADARPERRFTGLDNEPTGIPGGNIPGSVNIPFKKFMTNDEDSQFQTLLPPQQLKELFSNNGVDLTKPLVSTCTVGMTACTLALAAHVCGKEDVSVYDASWAEYYDRVVRVEQ